MFNISFSGPGSLGEYGAVADYGATMELVAVLQCKLQQKGFAPGTIDGLWGPNTSAALTSFAKSVGEANGRDAGTLVALRLDSEAVNAAIDFQLANKDKRPDMYIPEAAMTCSVPGASAAGFFKRNGKWIAIAAIGGVSILALILYARRKKHLAEMGDMYLYNNPWLEQTYGDAKRPESEHRRLSGKYRRLAKKHDKWAAEHRSGHWGYTYNNPWLKQAGYAGR